MQGQSFFVCYGKPKVSLPTFWQGLPAKIYYVFEYNGADQTEKIQPVRFWRHCIGTRPQVKNIIIHKTYPKLTFILEKLFVLNFGVDLPSRKMSMAR